MRWCKVAAPVLFLGLLSLAAPTSSARAQQEDPRAGCTSSYEKAQELRLDQKLSEARVQLLVCAQPGCSETARKDCALWLTEVDRDLPTVVFDVTGTDGKPLTTPTIEVDGKVLAQALEGNAYAVDPGKHTFVIRAGKEERKSTEILNVGVKNHRIVASFEIAKKPPIKPVTPPLPTEGPSVHPLVWVFGAVGVGAGGALIYFGVTALKEEATLEEECGVTRGCSQDDIDTVYMNRLLADISAGVTAGFLAAAVVTLAVSLSTGKQAANTVLITPTGAGFRF